MAVSLEQLLQDHPARLWRAREQGAASAMPAGLPTGYAALDSCLPGQGWPRQGLIEILSDQRGIGELRLLLPALARLCAETHKAGWLAWISPPCKPYVPALAAHGIETQWMFVVDTKLPEWAMHQALCSGACQAVLGWAECRERQSLRRLQLAAERSQCLAVLYRGTRFLAEPSPAVLRLVLEPSARALDVRLIKSRGGRPARVTLPR